MKIKIILLISVIISLLLGILLVLEKMENNKLIWEIECLSDELGDERAGY
jgi:hypothetical protein